MTLRIAIVHYHLRPGGVTRVIEHAVNTLTSRGHRVAVICGEGPDEILPDIPVAVLPELGYAIGDAPPPVADVVVDELRRAATAVLGGAPDVWHVHNHSLGKNTSLPATVAILAARGEPLLLQIHDFAEDSRPNNWAYLKHELGVGHEALYPQSARTAYAVLNGRDAEALRQAGIVSHALETLPNPVSTGDSESAPVDDGPPLFLYPTRAIRRKNLGEFLLWSQLAGGDARFATTLSPQNPAEQPRYERWRQVAAALRLPVDFAVGEDRSLSFEARMRSATALVTTSIAEGFGMGFLEPWLYGRGVLGRDLPAITADFRAAGVNLAALYTRLDVPLDWVNGEQLRSLLHDALRSSYQAYGRPVPTDALERAYLAAVSEDADYVDFGRLDESLQEAVLGRLSQDPGACRALRPERLDEHAPTAVEIVENRGCIVREFALETYGARLEGIYARLVEASPGTVSPLPPGKVLDAFLEPENCFLLRT